MAPESPVVILDDAPLGADAMRIFANPLRVIEAHQWDEVGPALDEIEAARTQGHVAAGWLAYELGYALVPKLAPLQWKRTGLPLLWFGVFERCERITRRDLRSTGRAYAGPLKHEWNEEAYTKRFRRVQDYIRAGDIYQANLSFRSHFAFAGDPLELFLTLRDRAGVRHGAYIDTGSHQILSLSPESFFALSPSGQITARPMKGTAPRGHDLAADRNARHELAASEKDRAENLMIVDLMRNDLGRVARIGSVHVPELFAIETYPTYHTMVSTVAAEIRPDIGVRPLVEALFPCGSITGAPKIRAMEIIRELEESPRGVYCGAIGQFAPDGSADFNVAIRTMLIEGGRGTLGVGGAVVHDSRAQSEYAECLLKARFFEAARRPIGLIETMAWDGEFVRGERHLERMKHSAGFLSLPFDEATAHAALAAAMSQLKEKSRVRLELDEEGQFHATATAMDAPAPLWRFAFSDVLVSSRDVLRTHKITWRDLYDEAFARLKSALDIDEVLFVNERGEVTEGSRTNVFVLRGETLITPPLSCGLLDGVLRRSLLDEGRCVEAILRPSDLESADAVFLGNSLRGLIPAVAVQASKPVARAQEQASEIC